LIDEANTAGATYQTLRAGHGPLSVAQYVSISSASASPTQGWAVALLDASDPSTNFVGTAAQSGVPTGRRGLALRHRFGGTDVVELLDLSGASPRVIVQGSNIVAIGGMAGVIQSSRLELEITPDDPTTPAVDETAIAATYPVPACTPLPACLLQGISCSNRSATPCGITVAPGSTWWLGSTAGSTTTATSVGLSGGTITREAVCSE
jgi:hypothetical protein